MIQKASHQYTTQTQIQKNELETYKQQILQQQEKEAYDLYYTIQNMENDANAILQNDILLQQQQEEQYQLAQRKLQQERQQELDKIEAEKKKQQEQLEKIAAEKKKQKEREEKLEAEEQKQKEERAKINAKKYAYRTNAQNLVQWLKQFRSTVQPFDKSKDMIVKKRRLNMKKIANGKINTLSHDKAKIETVIQDIGQAIHTSVQEDEAIQNQINSGAGNFSAEVTMGSKYLIDLIASSVIVRIQAEGFNGTRGDGFPLAHMLTHISIHVSSTTEFVNTLMAHIYTIL